MLFKCENPSKSLEEKYPTTFNSEQGIQCFKNLMRKLEANLSLQKDFLGTKTKSL